MIDFKAFDIGVQNALFDSPELVLIGHWRVGLVIAEQGTALIARYPAPPDKMAVGFRTVIIGAHDTAIIF
jgi:hypothetical protein